MTSVDFLVASCAVAVTGGSKVVKCRGHYSQRCTGGCGCALRRQIRMTLQADEANFLPHQHPRVGRSVRFMATIAAFKSYRGMFKRERAAFVGVATEAAWFVRGKRLRHGGPETAVGVVAIHARHGALGQPVFVGTLELRPRAGMARRALLINGGGLPGHQAERALGVDLVAGGAGDLILCVTALNSSRVRGLVQMALQASAVRRGRCQFRRVLDLCRRVCFRGRGTIRTSSHPSHASYRC